MMKLIEYKSDQSKNAFGFDAHNSLRSYELKMTFISKMVEGLCKSRLRGFVISGAPGIGKSYTVIESLNKFKDSLKLNIVINKGHITPYQLYKLMNNNCTESTILVFDDCDDVLDNTQALNLLKAATEFTPHRYVTWNSTLNGVAEVDDQFEFKGKIIVLTNKLLNNNPHYGAFIDRVQYYNCKVTFEEKLSKIMTLATAIGDKIDPGIDYVDVIKFILDNRDKIDQDRFSLRNFIKLAELRSMFGYDWIQYVNVMDNILDYK